MFPFVVRRVVVSFFILVGSSMLSFMLTVLSGDPLQNTYQMKEPERSIKQAAITDALHLDKSIPEQYALWVKEVGKCVASPFTGQTCTMGNTVNRAPVVDLIGNAIPTTFRLVIGATILALIVGVLIGVFTALRQYSVFDYSMTFIAFLCFSLPIFWIATMLKQYIAIDINDWLRNPTLTYPALAAISTVIAVIVAVLTGGGYRRWLPAAVIGWVASFGLIYVLLMTGWFETPNVGVIGVVLTAAAAVLVWTGLLGTLKRKEVRQLAPLQESIEASGGEGLPDLANGNGKTQLGGRPVLWSTCVTGALGVVVYLLIMYIPALGDWFSNPTWLTLFLAALSAVAVGCLVGYFMGGFHRSAAMRASVFTALTVGLVIFVEGLMSGYPGVVSATGGRPIPTQGQSTPGISDNFWVSNLDLVLHLVLPTLSIMLISLASYLRYTRASMLDIMSMDYIRTARSKGLPERTVIVRHAFRNAMIPVATIAALDFGAVLSGAIMTEQIFGWSGMGNLFVTALRNVDPQPLMAYLLVTSTMVVVFNMLADILYAFLDPRIRLS